MPAIRTHDTVFDEIDDDDGMPPLVDNPNPSMNFTFFTDMTPITYSPADTTRFEVLPDTFTISSSPELSESPSSFPDSPRPSHAKKRDASYIPRPPNAFILFRSSFIRSQQVPGKVEGNHSTLSKIIGMYWKTLPREEREVWEAKALVAQAEHRKRYPDWRFRPGANAMAKLKVKDGPGTGRRRNSQSNRKGKEDEEVKGQNMEKRCAKIADLLVEGKKGIDLEAAVKAWEGDKKNEKDVGVGKDRSEKPKDTTIVGQTTQEKEGKAKAGKKNKDKGSIMAQKKIDESGLGKDMKGEKETRDQIDARKTRCKTPGTILDSRFKVPLTAMFKRSLSAPASHSRTPLPGIPPSSHTHMRRESFTNTTSEVCRSPYAVYSSPPLPFKQHDEEPRANNHDIADAMNSASPVPTSMFSDSPVTRWDDPFASFDSPMTLIVENGTPRFEYDLTSPAPSPLEADPTNSFPLTSTLVEAFPRACKSDGFAGTTRDFDGRSTFSAQNSEPYSSAVQPSSYSTLKGWAGDNTRRNGHGALGPLSFISPFAADDAIAVSSDDFLTRTYGWPLAAYDGSYRTLNEEQSLQQYSAGLAAFSVNAPRGDRDHHGLGYV